MTSPSYDKKHSVTDFALQTIEAYRFVGFLGRHALPGEPVQGVSEGAAAEGRPVSLITSYSSLVRCQGAVANGAQVGPAADGSGRAVAGAGAFVAVRGAADGELATVVLAPGGGAAVAAGASLSVPVDIYNSNQVVSRSSVNSAADSVNQALHLIPLPAGIVGPNGQLLCEFEASSVNAGSRQLSLGYLVGETIMPLSVEISMTGTNTHYQQTFAVYFTSISAQKYRGTLQRNGASAAGFLTSAMDHSVPQTLVLAGRWQAATSGGVLRCEAIRLAGIYGA
jgi:hypothetical protein